MSIKDLFDARGGLDTELCEACQEDLVDGENILCADCILREVEWDGERSEDR